MKIGIVFGCFIPLHKGHMSLIDKSFAENDRTIIAICGKEDDRGKDFIPFNIRVTLMYDKYQNEYFSGKVSIVQIDDNKIGMDGTFTLQNWKVWCNELFSQVNENWASCGWAALDPNDDSNTITWYTGEPSYKEKIGAIYPNHKFSLADRSKINISGTEIRENPELYVESIASNFIDYLVRWNKLNPSVYDVLYGKQKKEEYPAHNKIELINKPDQKAFDNHVDARKAAALIVAKRYNITPLLAFEEVWEPDPEDYGPENADIVFTYKVGKSKREYMICCWHGALFSCKDCTHRDNNDICRKYHKRVRPNSPLCISYAMYSDNWWHIDKDNPFRKDK